MIAQRTRDIGDGYVGSDLLTMMLTSTDDAGEASFTAEEVRDEAMTLVLPGTRRRR